MGELAWEATEFGDLLAAGREQRRLSVSPPEHQVPPHQQGLKGEESEQSKARTAVWDDWEPYPRLHAEPFPSRTPCCPPGFFILPQL